MRTLLVQVFDISEDGRRHLSEKPAEYLIAFMFVFFFFPLNLNASLSRLLLLQFVLISFHVSLAPVEKGLSILDSFPLSIKVRWPMDFLF